MFTFYYNVNCNIKGRTFKQVTMNTKMPAFFITSTFYRTWWLQIVKIWCTVCTQKRLHSNLPCCFQMQKDLPFVNPSEEGQLSCLCGLGSNYITLISFVRKYNTFDMLANPGKSNKLAGPKVTWFWCVLCVVFTVLFKNVFW